MILTFPLLSHPLAMGLNLLLSTLLISVIIGVGGLRFWVSYTLMLILSGGLLVLFVYVSLLASNESFQNRWARGVLIVFRIGLLLAFGFKSDFGAAGFVDVSFEWLLKRLYNAELYRLTLFIIFYLLITLLVVVFNTKKNSYPLRRSK